MIVLVILLVLSALMNIVVYFIMKRFVLRAIQFDDMFVKIIDDVELFIEYFDGLLTKSTFSNSPDVIALSSNMKIMKERFEQYVAVFENVSVAKTHRRDEPEQERPVVVD